jgi:hypothetical protein
MPTVNRTLRRIQDTRAPLSALPLCPPGLPACALGCRCGCCERDLSRPRWKRCPVGRPASAPASPGESGWSVTTHSMDVRTAQWCTEDVSRVQSHLLVAIEEVHKLVRLAQTAVQVFRLQSLQLHLCGDSDKAKDASLYPIVRQKIIDMPVTHRGRCRPFSSSWRRWCPAPR